MNNRCGRAGVTLLLALLLIGLPGGTALAADCVTDAAGNVTCTNSAAITTTGYNEVGVNAWSKTASATGINTVTGSITTSGLYGYAVVASSDVQAAVVNDGALVTMGYRGSALVAISSSAGVTTATNGVTGTISTSGESAFGFQVLSREGPASATNSGTVSTTGSNAHALYASGPGGSVSVTNSGTVTTSGESSAGLLVVTYVSATVTNRGTVTVTGTSSAGIETGSGNDTVINSGTVSAANGPAINTAWGDDTVIIEGGAVSGLIDGGADWDRLDLPIPDVIVNAETWVNRDQIIARVLESGSATFNGYTYTWTNFEELVSWLQLAMLHDGRVNYLDLAATATAYCAGGGAQVYAIDADGQGEWAYNVTDAQVQAALAQALASGSHVLIADGLGVQLWALADLSAEGAPQLQLMGPDYLYIFPANTCGFTD